MSAKELKYSENARNLILTELTHLLMQLKLL
jgi:hypothetical protein